MLGEFEGYYVNKSKFITNENKERTLVFLESDISTESYDEALKDANKLWLLFIPIILMIIFIQILINKRKLTKSVETINKIIDSYEVKENTILKNDKNLEIEFEPIIENFKGLIKKVEQTNIDKNKMFANVSHDLKTPLTAIKGYAQAFKDEIVPEDKKEQYYNAIYNKSVIATDLIDKLFEYTKLEYPNYKMDLKKADIVEFLKEYIANRYDGIEIANCKLTISVPEKVINCEFDEKLISRLLDNLVWNSIKYNPQGVGLLVGLTEQEEKIRIIIADNGVGIPKDIIDNIFEPFVTNNVARTSGKGTGLGMSIAKKIVELHNGTIIYNINTESEYTTEFIIELKKYIEK